jgi:AraC-like DNA-binding protein
VDAARLVETFRRVGCALPEPVSVIERMELRFRLMEFTLRIGADFHTLYHARFGDVPCVFRPLETGRIWFDRMDDSRRVMIEWASSFAASFAACHTMPPAWRAAALLRARVAEPAGLRRLAADVGASRAAVLRGFRDAFGLTPHAYHARVRLRHALTELRAGPTKVAAAAHAAGFRSVKNFNRAARIHTGCPPSEIRGLAEADFGRLLAGLLCVEPDVLRRRAQNPVRSE